jgi:hypothetical protein
VKTLIRIEISRLRSRKSLRLLALALITGVVVAGTVTFFKTHRVTPAEVESARIAVIADHQRCMAGDPGMLPGEVKAPDRVGFCNETYNVETLQVGNAFRLTSLREIVEGTSILMILLGIAVGATFIGAEWHYNTVGAVLVWEPRRGRVLLAKGVACGLVVFAGAVVFELLVCSMLLPSALLHGSTSGGTAVWVRGVAGAAARGAAVAAIASWIGVSLATVTRNTAAAMGIAFVYLAVLESFIRAGLPSVARWMLEQNAGRFVIGHDAGDFAIRSTVQAGLLLGLYAAGSFTVATSFFRRRDVT